MTDTHVRLVLEVSQGRVLPTSMPDLFIVRLGDPPVVETPKDQMAGPILRKLRPALAKTGIAREAVFGRAPKKNFFVYSLDPTDANRIIREDAAGQKTVGRMVNGRFHKCRGVR